LACGQNFDSRWINVDQHAASKDVKIHDLRKPLPFSTDFADGIYCSHFLEHLDAKSADLFLKECLRCLKPEGTLRIVVPNFEDMAKDYLKIIGELEKDKNWLVEHEWMHLEIFDQFSRNRPEGQMKPFLKRGENCKNDFIRQRIGEAIDNFTHNSVEVNSQRMKNFPFKIALKNFFLKPTYRTNLIVKIFFPSQYQVFRVYPGDSIFKEISHMLVPGLSYLQVKQALFRNSGEVHLQSFDQYILKQKLSEAGFSEIQKVHSKLSAISNWNDYLLDINENGKERKADSLYMEAKKAGS